MNMVEVRKRDIGEMMVDYQMGDLAQDDETKLFQHLVNTKLIDKLPGFWKSRASRLIKCGRVKQPKR